MCGRYVLSLTGQTLASFFDAQLGAGSLSDGRTWNAAPTMSLPALVMGPEGHRVLEAASWGLVPNWSRRSGKESRPLINARVETVAEKASFRSAVQRGRILVPTNGFYEWAGPKGEKVPHAIRVRGEAIDPTTGARLGHEAEPGEPGEPFLMAGIAEEWTRPDGTIELSYAILTTTPNDLCAPIHDRMPVILEGDAAHAWLETPPSETERLFELARSPFPSDRMEAWAVSREVNDVRRDGPELTLPAPPEAEPAPTLFG